MELTWKQKRDRPNIYRAGPYKIVQYSYKWQDGSVIPCDIHYGAFHISRNRHSNYVETGVKSYETLELAMQACQLHSEGRAKS